MWPFSALPICLDSYLHFTMSTMLCFMVVIALN
jgi:hypothetical protein